MTNIDDVSGDRGGRGGRGARGEDGGQEMAGARVSPATTLVNLPGPGRWLTALAACFVVACVGLVSAGTARADVIDGAITSITTTATNTAQWEQVDFACTWAVPDGSSPDDTFSLQLPPELRWFGSTDFDLEDPDGQAVARGHADADGTVVFTLTDYVLSHPIGLHGTCHFSTQYTAATTGETVHLDFEVGDQVVRVDVVTAYPCTEDCAVDRTEPGKSMWWHDTAQTVTQSVIRAPATTSDLSDVTITDTPGAGLALDCATLAVTIGKVLDADGNVTAPRDDAQYVPEISCTTQAVSVTWSDVPAGEYTELWVRADVVDPSIATYTNAGSVVVDGRSEPVDAEVRHSDAGGDGEGTPSPTSSSSTTTSSTTTSPSTTATGSGTFTGPGTITSLATTEDTGAATTGGGTYSGSLGTSDSALAFTGSDALQLAAVAGLLLASGVLLVGFSRRGRRH